MKKIFITLAILFAGSAFYFLPMVNERFSSQSKSNIHYEADQNNYVRVNANDPSVSSKIRTPQLPENPNNYIDFNTDTIKEIYFTGSRFWELEAYMSRVVGVYDVKTGYTSPKKDALETIVLRYDATVVNLETIWAYYISALESRRIKDRPSWVFHSNYHDAVLIQRLLYEEDPDLDINVGPIHNFVLAEEDEQDYLEKNPDLETNIDMTRVQENRIVYTKPTLDVLASRLTSLQYEVTQENGTEEPYVNLYWDKYEDGIYVDIVTGQPLFSSLDKYDSDTGWPSFTRPIEEEVVTEVSSKPLIGFAKEVRSLNGDSHLGHVFGDGPEDQGGLRYCINSAALRFIPYGELDDKGYGHWEYLFEPEVSVENNK